MQERVIAPCGAQSRMCQAMGVLFRLLQSAPTSASSCTADTAWSHRAHWAQEAEKDRVEMRITDSAQCQTRGTRLTPVASSSERDMSFCLSQPAILCPPWIVCNLADASKGRCRNVGIVSARITEHTLPVSECIGVHACRYA